MNWVGRNEIYGLGWEGGELRFGLGGMRAMDWVGRDEIYRLGCEG